MLFYLLFDFIIRNTWQTNENRMSPYVTVCRRMYILSGEMESIVTY